MRQNVREINGKEETIIEGEKDPRVIFDVKFQIEDLVIYPEPVLISKDNGIRRFNRYQLNELKDEYLSSNEEIFQKAKNGVALLKARIQEEQTIQLKHNEMQNELKVQLTKKYPNIEMEHANIDLYIPGERAILIEIKTYDNPRECIREAIGQLLEYAFYHNMYKDPKLVIIGPKKATIEDHEYLNFICKKFDLKFSYAHYELGTTFNYTF